MPLLNAFGMAGTGFLSVFFVLTDAGAWSTGMAVSALILMICAFVISLR